MEETNLDIGIGNTESTTLQPKIVRIVGLSIRKVEIKGKENEKLVCMCKHPDREDTIEISQVKFERKGKLEISGTWISKDKEGLLIKNSALAIFLSIQGCKTIREIEGKEVSTILDERGYLCFRGY